jgi:hypothetical protein
MDGKKSLLKRNTDEGIWSKHAANQRELHTYLPQLKTTKKKKTATN